jgi:cysteinyl-tRNA synthetase
MLRLYNTLTGEKEEFKPIDPSLVRIYTCGPTVYNYAHIGNLRAYVFADILRRTLLYNGYKVKQVMNVTDVGQLVSDADEGEDKMTKGLRREGMPITLEAMRGLGERYVEAFVADLDALNIMRPSEIPKASDHIAEDIEIIKILADKGIAYKTSDGVYFDTAKFPEYGKLGNINLSGQRDGARVAANSEKRSQRDFSLWKFNAELGWQSPWGKGFPGWHVECSAMSRKYLGQPFDIHTGGVDHIPVHHNNEIAQSEAAYGAPLANYWMHNEFINVSGGKMAKSGENFLTLKALSGQNVSPLAYRYYLLGAKYGTPLKYEEPPLSLHATLENLRQRLLALPEGGKVDLGWRQKFLEAVNDDLNTPAGLAVLFAVLDDTKIPAEDRRATVFDFDRVLGLGLADAKIPPPEEVPAEIQKLASEREAARAAKNFKKSDELRQLIREKGFEINDTDTGSDIKPL